MRKKVLFASLMLLLASPLSFGQDVLKLDSRLIEGLDEARFHYNNKGLIDSTYLFFDDYDVYESYRKYKYSENGLCTREDDYQKLDGSFRHVSYIEYSYNEKNQLVKRMNYNSFGGEKFDVGGELKWTYNEDGTIATLETSLPSWDEPGRWDLYTREVYSYNEDKTLKSIVTHTVPFGSSQVLLYVSATVDYIYNDLKQLVRDDHRFYYEDSGDVPASTSYNTYEYDEAGNLVVYKSFIGLQSENPQVKYVYHYDLNVSAKDVIYPFNFEDKAAVNWIAASTSPNKLDYEEWWQVPNESDELFHVADYTLNYSAFDPSSIHQQQVDLNRVGFFISDNLLYLVNQKEGAMVNIYNACGEVVMQQIYTKNGISLEGLDRGVYVGKIENQRMPFKFMR